MQTLDQLAQWIRVVYFCQHCGYEFTDRPKLPTKCPQCKQTLRKFDKPEIDLRKKETEFLLDTV
jgi:predicted Zn-ribbon and HTH transcriptional regulator